MDESLKFQGNQRAIYNQEDLLSSLKDYLDVALLSILPPKTAVQKPDKSFNSNREFWTSCLTNSLYAGQIIKLNRFEILEWIPASPGLFYTEDAEYKRKYALESYLRWRKEEEDFSKFFTPQKNPFVIELRPDEKMGMVQGGYGSLRVGPKSVNRELQYIVGASSTGVSHEGLTITLKEKHYAKIIDEIKNGKTPKANIVGRLMILPTELSPIRLRYNEGIPKFYLDVEELEIINYSSSDNAVVSVAITYSAKTDYLRSSSFSYSFCSFSPSRNNRDLREAVLWLQDYAERYSKDSNPLIVGDFDEEFDHFGNVEFPIKEIANGRIPIDKLLYFKELFHLHINELFMGDKNVFNQSVIGAVGSNATSTDNTFQQLNYSAPDNLDYSKLIEQLAFLRQELVQKAKTPDEFKAIGDVAAAEIAPKTKTAARL